MGSQVLLTTCPSSGAPSSSSRSPHCWLTLKFLTINCMTLEPYCGILKAHQGLHSWVELGPTGTLQLLPFVASYNLLDFTSSYLLCPHCFPCADPLGIYTHTHCLLQTSPFLLVLQGWIEWASTGLKTISSQQTKMQPYDSPYYLYLLSRDFHFRG